MSTQTVSTIGEQRRHNYALQPMSQDDFVKVVTADQPEAPPYFTYDAVLNSKERATLEKVLERELHPLSLEEVLSLVDTGTQILDAREPAEFAKAHLAGSINIGLGGQYASWAGTILSRDKSIVIISEPGRQEEAALRLGRIGFDHVAGYLADGIRALESRPDLVDGTERVTGPMLAEELASPTPPAVIDVRTPNEWHSARIEGSVNIPLNRLRERLAEVPRDRRIMLLCEGGYRSSIAASMLAQHGFENLADLAGGMTAWQAAGMPVRSSELETPSKSK